MTTPTKSNARGRAPRRSPAVGADADGSGAEVGSGAGPGPLFDLAASTRGAPEAPSPARKILVTGPPGSGKSRLALDFFDDAVRREGPDAALLVLPTYGQVEHAKRLAITRRGDRPDVRGLLDVSYATFTSLRERLAPGFRVRGLPSRRRRDLFADEALSISDSPLFRPVRDRPGFRARFLRLVKELKQTGEEPASLLARARAASGALEDGPRERLEAFLDAWERYEGLLATASTPDHEDALRALVGELGGGARRSTIGRPRSGPFGSSWSTGSTTSPGSRPACSRRRPPSSSPRAGASSSRCRGTSGGPISSRPRPRSGPGS